MLWAGEGGPDTEEGQRDFLEEAGSNQDLGGWAGPGNSEKGRALLGEGAARTKAWQ